MGVHDRDWYWQDRDRKDGRRQHRWASSWRDRPVIVALGVIVGAAFVWLVAVLILQWRAQVAMEQLQGTAEQAARRVQAQAVQTRRRTEEMQAGRLAVQQRHDMQRSQAIAERQRIETQRSERLAAETVRKERAWARFYRKPAICDDAATMECANAFIRAKRSFEERYARGELSRGVGADDARIAN